MTDHDQSQTRVPTQSKAQPTPAPKPKAAKPDSATVAEMRRLLDHGTATAAWLRDPVIPSLSRFAAGKERDDEQLLDLPAFRALSTIKDILARTTLADEKTPFVTGQVFEIPDELVDQRKRLRVDHDRLRPQVDALVKAVHARKPAKRPDPKLEHEKPHPRQHASYSIHAAGPPSFDFGKVAPGHEKTLSLPIFNLVPHLASASFQFHGSSAIRLHSAPKHLAAAGSQIADGTQHIALVFMAPATRGLHRGTVQVDLSWVGLRPETLEIPVRAHSALDTDVTDDEVRPYIEERRREREEEATRVKHVKQADDELAAFRLKHPGFHNATFEQNLKEVLSAVEQVERQQKNGIDRAAEEIKLYRKAAPPAAKPSVLFELAMLALNMASAGVANVVAKGIEGGLRDLATSASLKTIVLGDSTIYGVSDAVKEGLKIGAKRALPSPDSGGSPKPATPHPNHSDLSSDARIAFLEIINDEHNSRADDRRVGAIRSASLLHPTLYKNPELAVQALKVVRERLKAEAGGARTRFYEATIRRWFGFIAELRLDVHRVGSVEGGGIRPVRGVVDIGFQPGRGPRDPVIAKSAIMRGVSNAALSKIRPKPLLHEDIPIRLYGLPSPNHAELLVTVTRAPDGTVSYVDKSNGSAPGPGGWLKFRGYGEPLAGAQSLLKEILSRSLEEQKVFIESDQDPAMEMP